MKSKIMRILSAAFAISLCIIVFVACGNDDIDNDNNKDTTTTITTSTTKTINGVTYRFNNNQKTYYVYSANKTITNVVLEKSIDSYPVTEIEEEAFADCTSLIEITLSNNITTIYKMAFINCTSLKSIVIPDSVKQIYRMVFWNCTALKSLRIPNSIKTISDHLTFDCKNLETVYIPKSVITIEASAFGFNYSRVVPNIHYEGTKNEWKNVIVKEGNSQYTYTDNFTFNSYPSLI